MIIKICSRQSLALYLTLLLLGTSAQGMLPGHRGQVRISELTVTGKVTVNGRPAATGDTVSSGSTVETAKGSSAVVSLGKLGRVEALPETRMKLRDDGESISILLDAGSVKVYTGANVAATVTRSQ